MSDEETAVGLMPANATAEGRVAVTVAPLTLATAVSECALIGLPRGDALEGADDPELVALLEATLKDAGAESEAGADGEAGGASIRALQLGLLFWLTGRSGAAAEALGLACQHIPRSDARWRVACLTLADVYLEVNGGAVDAGTCDLGPLEGLSSEDLVFGVTELLDEVAGEAAVGKGGGGGNGDVEVLLRRGVLEGQQGDLGRAVELVRQAVAADPLHTKADLVLDQLEEAIDGGGGDVGAEAALSEARAVRAAQRAAKAEARRAAKEIRDQERAERRAERRAQSKAQAQAFAAALKAQMGHEHDVLQGVSVRPSVGPGVGWKWGLLGS